MDIQKKNQVERTLQHKIHIKMPENHAQEDLTQLHKDYAQQAEKLAPKELPRTPGKKQQKPAPMPVTLSSKPGTMDTAQSDKEKQQQATQVVKLPAADPSIEKFTSIQLHTQQSSTQETNLSIIEQMNETSTTVFDQNNLNVANNRNQSSHRNNFLKNQNSIEQTAYQTARFSTQSKGFFSIQPSLAQTLGDFNPGSKAHNSKGPLSPLGPNQTFGQKHVSMDIRHLNKISKYELNSNQFIDQVNLNSGDRLSPFERSQDDLKAYPCKKGQLPVIKYRKQSLPLTSQRTILPTSPQMNKTGLEIPRRLSVTSRIEDNDVDIVRNRFRINNIRHKDFDVSLKTRETQRYWQGIYQRNNPEHVRETDQGANQPHNLYQVIQKNKIDAKDPDRPANQFEDDNEEFQRRKMTNWAAMRAPKPPHQNAAAEEERREALNELGTREFFNYCMQLYEDQVQGQLRVEPKTNAAYEDLKDFYLRKCVSKLTKNDFLVYQKQVERMVDEGYHCEMKNEDDFQRLKKAKHAVSELEEKYFNNLKKRGVQFDDPRVPTPESETEVKIYPNVSDEVDNMIKKYNANPTVIHKPIRLNAKAKAGGLASVVSPNNKNKVVFKTVADDRLKKVDKNRRSPFKLCSPAAKDQTSTKDFSSTSYKFFSPKCITSRATQGQLGEQQQKQVHHLEVHMRTEADSNQIDDTNIFNIKKGTKFSNTNVSENLLVQDQDPNKIQMDSKFKTKTNIIQESANSVSDSSSRLSISELNDIYQKSNGSSIEEQMNSNVGGKRFRNTIATGVKSNIDAHSQLQINTSRFGLQNEQIPDKVDVNHEFYNCLAKIVNYNKPLPPGKDRISKKQGDQQSESASNANFQSQFTSQMNIGVYDSAKRGTEDDQSQAGFNQTLNSMKGATNKAPFQESTNQARPRGLSKNSSPADSVSNLESSFRFDVGNLDTMPIKSGYGPQVYQPTTVEQIKTPAQATFQRRATFQAKKIPTLGSFSNMPVPGKQNNDKRRMSLASTNTGKGLNANINPAHLQKLEQAEQILNTIGNPSLITDETREAQQLTDRIQADERPALAKLKVNQVTAALEDCLELMQFKEQPVVKDYITYQVDADKMVEQLFKGEEEVLKLRQDMTEQSKQINVICTGVSDRVWKMSNFSKQRYVRKWAPEQQP